MEDYELMHRMIEKERSERMEETILSGYLSNLGKYTEGRPAGEWVSFPTTAEHLKEVFDRIGIDGKNYGGAAHHRIPVLYCGTGRKIDRA